MPGADFDDDRHLAVHAGYSIGAKSSMLNIIGSVAPIAKPEPDLTCIIATGQLTHGLQMTDFSRK